MNRSRTSLERAILSTLAYFDIFRQPLRTEELWRWLYVADDRDHAAVRSADPHDVEVAVRQLEQTGEVERSGDFLSLRGRSTIVADRMSRRIAGRRLWRRARFVASFLRIVPFVRFIGVVNSLAFDLVRPESDIDLFVIVRRGRLWQTRLAVTLLIQILGMRRHGRNVASRVCLSFFMTDRNLALEGLKIGDEDPYLVFWTAGVVPMFERGGTWMRFLRENGWTGRRLPHADSASPAPILPDSWLPGTLRTFGELILGTWVGGGLEVLSKRLQLIKMRFPSVPDEQRGESGVVINDDILKFHERDRRRQYDQAFAERREQVV